MNYSNILEFQADLDEAKTTDCALPGGALPLDAAKIAQLETAVIAAYEK